MANKRRWHFLDKMIKEHNYLMGAELGINIGNNIMYLLKNNPELAMVAVDNWDPNYHWFDAPESERIFKNRLMLNKCQNRVAIIKDLSYNVAARFNDGFFDFVFIDASHIYKDVVKDINAWYPKVRIGGLFSGHDINWPDVTLAVNQLLPDYKTDVDNVWYLVKEEK